MSSNRVWVHYPFLPNHSEVVYDGPEGCVYFGGDAPANVDDMVWTGASFSVLRPTEPTQRLLVLEPPRVEPISHSDDFLKEFPRVYTFGKTELPNARYYRYGIPPLWPALGNVNLRPWAERKNAVVCVTGNKYPERFERLETYDFVCETIGLEFDVYGRPGFDMPWYRGELPGDSYAKRDLLSQYRYCLALENTFDNPLYLSEKLLDGLVSGCFCQYEGGPVQETYPSIPWDLVGWDSVELLRNSHSHAEYLDVLTRAMPTIRTETSLDPLWRMILEDTK